MSEIYKPAPFALKLAASILAKGGVCLIPTETVYGIAASASFAGSEEILREIKGRQASVPFQRLAASIEMIEDSGCALTQSERLIAEAFWPGPLTLVVKHSTSGEKTGFRIPAYEVPLSIIKELGCCLVATSANLSGAPAPRGFKDVDASIARACGLCIDAGDCPLGAASTVAEIEDRRLIIHRAGPVTQSAMELVLKSSGHGL